MDDDIPINYPTVCIDNLIPEIRPTIMTPESIEAIGETQFKDPIPQRFSRQAQENNESINQFVMIRKDFYR